MEFCQSKKVGTLTNLYIAFSQCVQTLTLYVSGSDEHRAPTDLSRAGDRFLSVCTNLYIAFSQCVQTLTLYFRLRQTSCTCWSVTRRRSGRSRMSCTSALVCTAASSPRTNSSAARTSTRANPKRRKREAAPFRVSQSTFFLKIWRHWRLVYM